MLKLSKKALDDLERQYPGIKETVYRCEEASLPVCPYCQSEDTADVGCGIVGRSINLAAATTKFKLTPNPPKPGEYFCNSCETFFS